MESGIKKIHKYLQSFNLLEEVKKVLTESGEELIDLIRDQMHSGEDSKGMMFPYASNKYARAKAAMSSYRAPYPIRNLYLTGSFQRLIFIKIEGSTWAFWSTDRKTDKIVDLDGYQIFDLNPKRMVMSKNIVQSKIVANISKQFE